MPEDQEWADRVGYIEDVNEDSERLKEDFMKIIPPLEGHQIDGIFVTGVWIPNGIKERIRAGEHIRDESMHIAMMAWPAARIQDFLKICHNAYMETLENGLWKEFGGDDQD